MCGDGWGGGERVLLLSDPLLLKLTEGHLDNLNLFMPTGLCISQKMLANDLGTLR